VEVSVTKQILQKISKFPEILGELSMRKQCVPGSFFSAHSLEPGNKASGHCITYMMREMQQVSVCLLGWEEVLNAGKISHVYLPQASGPPLPPLALDHLPVAASPSLPLTTTKQCFLGETNSMAGSVIAT